jgi:hypothetical protein
MNWHELNQHIQLMQDLSVAWTLSPFSSQGNLPVPVNLMWNGDNVYFAEVISDQLVPGGHGPGALAEKNQLSVAEQESGYGQRAQSIPALTVDPGFVLRWVFW